MRVDAEGAVPGVFADGGPDAAVLTPAHQAILGATLANDRRTEFVRIAAQRGGYILEDDYDGEFRYGRPPIGAMQGLAPEQVIYAGTASKSLAPGLRLGWLVVPEAVLEPVVEAKRRADRGTDVLAQLAFADLVRTGAFDRHVRRMRLRYRRRRDLLVETMACSLPGVTPLGVAAGLHLVAELSSSGVCTEADVMAAAERHSVGLVGLERFWHMQGETRGIVLGYGAPAEHDYASAVGRLVTMLGELT
jgi:GntR family transcriptional regulator/MocR family aminotransferase